MQYQPQYQPASQAYYQPAPQSQPAQQVYTTGPLPAFIQQPAQRQTVTQYQQQPAGQYQYQPQQVVYQQAPLQQAQQSSLLPTQQVIQYKGQAMQAQFAPAQTILGISGNMNPIVQRSGTTPIQSNQPLNILPPQGYLQHQVQHMQAPMTTHVSGGLQGYQIPSASTRIAGQQVGYSNAPLTQTANFSAAAGVPAQRGSYTKYDLHMQPLRQGEKVYHPGEKESSEYKEIIRRQLDGNKQAAPAANNGNVSRTAGNPAPAPTQAQAQATLQGSRPGDIDNEELYEVTEHYSDGSTYIGQKKGVSRHGQGKLYYVNGGVYEGAWKSGKMDGHGKLFFPNAQIAYEGEFQEDKFHGQGTLYNERPEQLGTAFDYNNFDEVGEFWLKYEGQFREDAKEGHGTFTLTNGEWYEGQFFQDAIHGQGIYHRLNGEIITGVWNENHLEKMLKIDNAQ